MGWRHFLSEEEQRVTRAQKKHIYLIWRVQEGLQKTYKENRKLAKQEEDNSADEADTRAKS